jgi:hypothetical protein
MVVGWRSWTGYPHVPAFYPVDRSIAVSCYRVPERDRVLAILRVAEIIKPTIDTLKAKLATLTA